MIYRAESLLLFYYSVPGGFWDWRFWENGLGRHHASHFPVPALVNQSQIIIQSIHLRWHFYNL